VEVKVIDRQLMERQFKRFDQFDYQRFGIENYWYARKTLAMLVSFYMEANELFEKDDPVVTFNKLHSNFRIFIVSKGLSSGKVKFENMVGEHENTYYEPGAVDLVRACFHKEDLLSYIESNNVIKLDVPRLRKFLSGDEKPNIPAVVYEPQAPNVESLVPSQPVPTVVEAVKPDACKMESQSQPKRLTHQFIFQKTGKTWTLQFEDACLTGVKDWAGMDYIKLLLYNPGKLVNVLQMQALVGNGGLQVDNDEDNGAGKKEKIYDENDDNDESNSVDFNNYGNAGPNNKPVGGANAWDGVDRRAIRDAEVELSNIVEKLRVANSSNVRNTSKIKRFEEEKTKIEKYLYEARCKGKDPEVETARRYMRKMVPEAIAKIKKLEMLCNYNDTPISSHLRRHIKFGAFCSYGASLDEPPAWKF
jgi:hypothetical protein